METIDFLEHEIWLTESFFWVYSIDGGPWRGDEIYPYFRTKEDCVLEAKLEVLRVIDPLFFRSISVTEKAILNSLRGE